MQPFHKLLDKAQISYSIPNRFTGNLPPRYSDSKITLTYAIQVIHEHFSDKIHALVLAGIPNGKLINVYGDKIIKAGKGGWMKAKDFRFRYKLGNEIVRFELVERKPPRVEVITALKGSSILEELNLRINHFYDA